MWCALVFYFVVTIIVVVYSLPELCVFQDNVQKAAYCGTHDVDYILNFIPPISKNISYIDLSGQPLKQLLYNGFRNLSSQNSISTIRLPYCQISDVDARAFLYLHNLSIIDLSHNNISHIDTKIFGDTKPIKSIYMHYNKIETLPNGIFENLALLEEVYLHHNQISQVEKYSFKNTPSLRIIDLNNNRIQFINMLFKNKFDTLTTLSLYGNPWKCNCKLGQLYEFLEQFNQLNQQVLVCEKPPILHGRKWNDISRNEFVCSSEVTISGQDSVITSTEPVITAELVITKGTIVKLDKEEENIEKKTITTFQNRTIVTEKPDTEQKPEIRMEKSDVTQNPVIIDEKRIPEVEADTNKSVIWNSELDPEPDAATEESNTEMEEPIITDEPAIKEFTTITESIKTPQNPVDDPIVTTSEVSSTNYEEADRNLEQSLKNLQWMAWTLFSVAMICLLIVAIAFGCAAKFTFASFKRKNLSRTDEHIEQTSGLIYFQRARQENC